MTMRRSEREVAMQLKATRPTMCGRCGSDFWLHHSGVYLHEGCPERELPYPPKQEEDAPQVEELSEDAKRVAVLQAVYARLCWDEAMDRLAEQEDAAL